MTPSRNSTAPSSQEPEAQLRSAEEAAEPPQEAQHPPEAEQYQL